MLTRDFYIAALILTAFAIACTQIPLLNYLGFEFSVATVLVAGFISGILTISYGKETEFKEKSHLWLFVGKTFFTQVLLLIVPLIILFANIFFVKNCSIENGLILYALIVLPGVFFSTALALLVNIFFNKWNKSIFAITYFVILLHIPLVGLLKPQIFTFNLIIGYFPGFTYDEALLITRRLLIFRLHTLIITLLIISITVWLWEIKSSKKRYGKIIIPLTETVIIALVLPAVIIGITFSERLGFSSSEKFIRQKLAGNYKTSHFEIIYPAGSIKRERIELIGKLHEFYLSQLNKELKLQSIETITTFIYSDPEQKGRLIGASNTNIAKPWLRQIHINNSDLEASLKHEIVHVLASDFGWSPLRIGKNIGLTEGLAMALERSSTVGGYLHYTAALIFSAGINPDIASLFSFGKFAMENASVSYNIVGSFCRYLIDTRGIETYKKLYASGNFKEIYRKDLHELANEWKASLKTISLNQNDAIKAQYLFRRPSIFAKECARVLANLNNKAKESLNRHEFEEVLKIAEYSLSLSKTPEAINRKIGALFELQKFQEVIEFLELQLKDSTINFLLLPLKLRLGDSYWAIDSITKAKAQYEALANTHLNDWYDEICALRLETLKNPKAQKNLKQFFIYTIEDTIRIKRLEQLNEPLARLLLAREYASKGRYYESINELSKLESNKLIALEYFRLKHLGIAYFSIEEYKTAKEFFRKALLLAPSIISEWNTRDWIQRCEFEQSYVEKVPIN